MSGALAIMLEIDGFYFSSTSSNPVLLSAINNYEFAYFLSVAYTE
jgi:hypothetical protein